MAQIIIDTGAAANDGTGDPLRTAFTDTNTNFTEIYTAGPVASNVRIANNTISTITTNGNLVLAPNGVGVVQSNVNIVPNSSNIRNLGSSTQRWSSLYVQYANISGSLDLAGNFSAATVTTPELIVNTISSDDSTVVKIQDGVEVDGDMLANGNVTADYFIGNGSQLTGLAATYGNANVVTLLAGFGNNTVSTTGNVSGGYLFGNGSQLTGLPATYGNANVVANLAALGSNPVSSTGNVTAGNVLTGGLISATSTITSAANITAGNVLTGGLISATGNITGAYVLGNGSALTNLPAPVVTQDITSNGAMSIMTYDGVIKYVNYATVEPSSGNIASGNITTTGLVSASGNVTAGNIITSGIITAAAGDTLILQAAAGQNADLMSNNGNNVVYVNDTAAYVQTVDGVGTVSLWTFSTSGNLSAPGNISAVGNIIGGNFLTGGLISATGNISGGNLVTSGLATVTGNITGGNLITAGLISATGNVSGNFFIGNGSQLTGIAASYGNANVATFLAAYGSNTISTSGNITAGNLIGNISITSNVVGTQANVTLVAGSYSTVFDNTGVATFPGNIITAGNISATGSILATPDWTSAGAITLTATTTNPTKGTTTSDNISYRQLGTKQWEVVMTYIQSSGSGGANGSGDYLVTLPNGLSFDTTLPSQPIYTSGVGTSTFAHLPYVIPNCNGTITNDTNGAQIFPMVYNATKFRVLTLTYGVGIQCWGSPFYSATDDPKIQLTFRFTST